jgi:hypothetical protein
MSTGVCGNLPISKEQLGNAACHFRCGHIFHLSCVVHMRENSKTQSGENGIFFCPGCLVEKKILQQCI